VPTYEVVFRRRSGAARPDRGDIFFDFEGDPLYTETPPPGAHRSGASTTCSAGSTTRAVHAAVGAQLRRGEAALETFLDVALRRAAHPGMHIYHYAPYETTHLLAMAARYGVREAEVDALLREGVFVDLYPIVRRALRVGSRSYSIKKLEPLYMGAEVRTSDVQRGDDSIVKYVEARCWTRGRMPQAQGVLDDLADYNRYDCVSTGAARLARRAGPRGEPRSLRRHRPSERPYEPSPRAERSDGSPRVPHRRRSPTSAPSRLALGAAAIDYYPREAKTFWATLPAAARARVDLGGHARRRRLRPRPLTRAHRLARPRGRAQRRVVELRGDLAPGTKLTADASTFVLYELPRRSRSTRVRAGSTRHARCASSTTLDDGVSSRRTPLPVSPGRSCRSR
jgi:uncharacterized protein